MGGFYELSSTQIIRSDRKTEISEISNHRKREVINHRKMFPKLKGINERRVGGGGGGYVANLP